MRPRAAAMESVAATQIALRRTSADSKSESEDGFHMDERCLKESKRLAFSEQVLLTTMELEKLKRRLETVRFGLLLLSDERCVAWRK